LSYLKDRCRDDNALPVKKGRFEPVELVEPVECGNGATAPVVPTAPVAPVAPVVPVAPTAPVAPTPGSSGPRCTIQLHLPFHLVRLAVLPSLVWHKTLDTLIARGRAVVNGRPGGCP